MEQNKFSRGAGFVGMALLRGLKFMVFITLAVLFFGVVVMYLWNWLMPDLVGANQITLLQSFGLIILTRILFGGFGKGGGHWKRHQWRHRMEERWQQMSPEQKAKFRKGFYGPCKGNFADQDTVETTAEEVPKAESE